MVVSDSQTLNMTSSFENDVLILITMPWASLSHPSIQLGILVEVARHAGFKSSTRHFNLSFASYLREKARTEGHDFKLQDYMHIAIKGMAYGMGEWAFATSPFRKPNVQLDQSYLEWLSNEGEKQQTIELLQWLRNQVPEFIRECVADVLSKKPTVVGFTTGFSQTLPALLLAQSIKEAAPDVFIIFGGADCDGPMGEGLIHAFDFIDVVVRGEGEPVLADLLKCITEKNVAKAQPGLCVRTDSGIELHDRPSGGRVDMDSTPIPDFSEYFKQLKTNKLMREIHPTIELPIESSRGCWWGQKHHCTFCGFNGQELRFRAKSEERILIELDTLSKRWSTLNFMMTDAIIDQAYFHSVLPKLAKENSDYQIFYETKANLKRKQVCALRDAGIAHIQPGIESLDSEILSMMRKGSTALINIRLLKYCHEYGVNTLWNIIYGFPGERPEAYLEMADLVLSLSHLQPPECVPLVLDRFSPYHQNPEEFGLEIVGPPSHFKYIYPQNDDVSSQLLNISYNFDYKHKNGCVPSDYAKPLIEAVKKWQAGYSYSSTALRHQRGPGFIKITDERKSLPSGVYYLEGWNADAYLACDAGASAMSIHRTMLSTYENPPKLNQIQDFLDGLTEQRLLFHEKGKFLSLSVSVNRKYPSALLNA